MKLRSIILMLFTCLVANSQSTIDLKFYDVCNDTIVNLEYTIQPLDISIDDFFAPSSIDSIRTIKPSKYFIEVFLDADSLDYRTFSFTKEIFDKVRCFDTINIPRVYEKIRHTGQYTNLSLGYFECDKICNGYITDYYRNNKIRLEGEFKNGVPINEIRKYNFSGELTEIEIYDKDGNLKEIKIPE